MSNKNNFIIKHSLLAIKYRAFKSLDYLKRNEEVPETE